MKAGRAPRLVQRPTGYRHTCITGVVAVGGDEFTGELPDRLVHSRR